MKCNRDLKSLFTPTYEKSYMVSLRNSREFLAVLRRYGKVYTRVLFAGSKVSTRLQLLTNYGNMLLRLNKHHGPVFVVKYLKCLTVALQRFIGGQPLSSLRELEPDLPLPRLTSSGLPNFIPLRDRRAIEKLTPSVIRWWLTLFSMYRIISCPGKIKLSTITDPFGGNPERLEEISMWLFTYSKQFISFFSSRFEFRASLGLERILKASPTSRVSWKGFLVDAEKWKGKTAFFQFANFGQFSLYFDWFNLIKLGIPPFVPKDDDKSSPYLGQLALKEEAAGKIRVFAMVDIWTQSVLRPLHDWLFELFKKLPNDCTHNQDAGFRRAQEKAVKYGSAWCYDLSAATDRLPIKLQVAILNSLFGHIPCSGYDTGLTFGQAWANLMTDRVYHLPASHLNEKPVDVKYAVGQPMGALSSWAMLNLSHHLILQMICYQIYKKVKWYDCYEVLGDDIVIFDSKVADHYFRIMEGDLGVQCNKSKSLIAPGRPVIEFAKRVSIGMEEVSPFSWRQIRSLDSLMGRSSVACDLIMRKGIKHPMRAFTAITGPEWGKVSSRLYSLLAYLGQLVNKRVIPFKVVSDFLVDPKNPFRYIGYRIIAHVRPGPMEDILCRHHRGLPLQFPKIDPRLDKVIRVHDAYVRGYLEERIVELTLRLHDSVKTCALQLQRSLGPSPNGIMIPDFVLLDLFYPGARFRDRVSLVDLGTLDFDGLVSRMEKLEQLDRDFHFFNLTVKRRIEAENSFKLLSFIQRSKRKGWLSFEIER